MIARPTETLDAPQLYRLLASLVIPRPIALVSSLSAAGVPNLAPFSFYCFLNDVPPMLGVSIGLRHGKSHKDTLVNVSDTKEFVINVVDEDMAKPMNVASLDWGPEVDEFERSGFEPATDNLVVRPARVKVAPAAFECRLERLIEFPRYTMICGEVVAFHYREDLFDARMHLDYDKLRALGRLTGPDYCRTSDRFAMVRDADSPDLHRGR